VRNGEPVLDTPALRAMTLDELTVRRADLLDAIVVRGTNTGPDRRGELARVEREIGRAGPRPRAPRPASDDDAGRRPDRATVVNRLPIR
jgi:hypothetical protein